MLHFVLMGLIIEKLDLRYLLISLLYKDTASFDHLLALSEYLFNFVEVVLFYSFQECIETSPDVLNPL